MKERFAKAISICCTAAMLCMAFAGCGSTQKVPEPTENINFYLPTNQEILTRAYVEFHKENKEVKAEYDAANSEQTYLLLFGKQITEDAGKTLLGLNEYYDTLKNELMKGGAKDIIFADAAYQVVDDLSVIDYNKMLQGGAFVNLAPIFEQYAPEFDLTPYDSLRTADGKLFAVPFNTDPFHLQSAQALLNEWEFDFHPEENVLEFLRRCKVWQDAHENDPDAPAVFSQTAWNYLEQNIFSIIGTDYINYDNKTAEVNTPEVVEIMGLLRDLQSDRPEEALNSDPELYAEQYGTFLFGGYMGVYDIYQHAYPAPWAAQMNTVHPEHKTILMPLRTLDGKVNSKAVFYLMIPTNAANQVNGAKYIEKLIQAAVEDKNPDFNVGVAGYPEQAAKEKCENWCKNYYNAYGSADFQTVMLGMYEDRGNICMPDYWMTGAQSLLDNYYKGSISPEDVVKQLDERLKIYVSE